MLALLEEGDGRIFSLRREPQSAESWTVPWHASPEERQIEGGRLARRLRFLGFGSVGNGMWISPYDREREVVGLIDELRVAGHTGGYARWPGRLGGSPRARVAGLGPRCARRASPHRHREFSAFGKAGRRGGMGDQEAFLPRTRLVHVFRRFAALDPELPDDLIHAPRHRARAVALFHRLYEALAPAAQRHFEAVTTPP